MIILHGDNIVSSRNSLHIKKAEWRKQGVSDILSIEGKNCSLGELQQAVESQNLFGGKQAVVIEGFISRAKSKEKTLIENYLSQENPQDCILWEDKKLTTTQLKKFPKAKVEESKTSSVLFEFLDTLGINMQNSAKLLKKVIEADSAGGVFFMLARQVRLMLQSQDQNNAIAPWQRQKLQKSLKVLTEELVIFLHTELLLIDEKQKTGKGGGGLDSELEVLISKLYYKMYEKV